MVLSFFFCPVLLSGLLATAILRFLFTMHDSVITHKIPAHPRKARANPDPGEDKAPVIYLY